MYTRTAAWACNATPLPIWNVEGFRMVLNNVSGGRDSNVVSGFRDAVPARSTGHGMTSETGDLRGRRRLSSKNKEAKIGKRLDFAELDLGAKISECNEPHRARVSQSRHFLLCVMCVGALFF